MAKKIKLKKSQQNEKFLEMFNQLNSEGNPIDLSELEEACNDALSLMDEEEMDLFAAMRYLMDHGVTPEEYALHYDVFQRAKSIGPLEGEDMDLTRYLRRSTVEEYEPLENAGEYTLVLKIQMKDVIKPPMWREVEVPANIDFMVLHEVIQEVMGFSNAHLWQFNKSAYDSSLSISERDDDMDFSENVTHEAKETPLTMFLQQKKDELEYVYDFGDDWIFTIEVKGLIHKKSEHPVCRKFKSELNPIEDCGGVWSYLAMRGDLAEWNTLSKSQRRKRAAEKGFDSAVEYFEFMVENIIDLDAVNDYLAGF